jgi:hypothetical protein
MSATRASLPRVVRSGAQPEYVEKAEFQNTIQELSERLIELQEELQEKEKADYALTYLDDLLNVGSSNDDTINRAMRFYKTLPIPDQAVLPISELLKAESDFKKNIESRANKLRLTSGRQLDKGFMPAEKQKKPTKGQMDIEKYITEFYENDPIAHNHNGVVETEIVDANNDLLDPTALNIQDFIGYSMRSIPQRDDALKYVINQQDKKKNTYLKYQMPTALFHRDDSLNGPLQFGPSINPYRFNKNGITDPSFVIPRSIDAFNLAEVASKSPKTMFGKVDIKVLKTRYTFPNFLLGEMLYQSEGVPESTEVFRPYPPIDDNYKEFWVKVYGTGFYFPYDKSKYFLPPDWYMVERADGVIMYFNEKTKEMKSNFPLGSYMIMPDGVTIDDVIKNTVTCQKIKNNVTDLVDAYVDLARTTNTDFDSSNIKAQQHFGLIAYMTNLDSVISKHVNLEEGGEEYGGNKKKKSKRTNIKYMKKMKRTKRTKRTKRMNIKYMKKSKKNHHK